MRSIFAVAAVVALVLGCGPSAPPASSGGSGGAPESTPAAAPSGDAPPEIARVHRSRCGACHQRVEPGTRTRPVIEAALARHHTRVHLTDAQWAAMVDYLAPR